MVKPSYLKAVFFLTAVTLTTGISLEQPLSASPKYPYPVVSSSDTNQLACYVRTSNGTTLDLSSLCGKKPESSTPTAPIGPDGQPLAIESDGLPLPSGDPSLFVYPTKGLTWQE